MKTKKEENKIRCRIHDSTCNCKWQQEFG